MFHIGDKVVHPMHGAGIVESIVQKKVNGVTRDYYILKLPVRAMVVMVPVEHCEEIGVRPIVDRSLAPTPAVGDSVAHILEQILISEIVMCQSSSYEAVEERINQALA